MMATCVGQAVGPFNKFVHADIRRQSESQSEISSESSDWSDLKSIAVKLGINNPDDMVTERFKVDRQKLETMIKSIYLI